MDWSDYFTKKTRPNGDNFFCLKDEAPEILSDFVHEVHKQLYCGLPDDWIYENIYHAFESYELDGYANVEPDTYGLATWATNGWARGFCNEVLQHGGVFKYFDDLISCAQSAALNIICEEVDNFAEEHASYDEEEEDEDETQTN